MFESEKAQGNDFVASVTAQVQGLADESDRLEDTVDYSALASLLLELNGSATFDTVERLAGAFCERALADFPAVSAIEVTIDKLRPVGMDGVESCGVRLTQVRGR